MPQPHQETPTPIARRPQLAPVRSSWEDARGFMERAAGHLGIDDEIVMLLRSPFREMHVEVPVRMDDGRLRGVPGLPRPAQRRARAVQGRRPLPPGRRPGRGARAGGADDVEVRARRHPVRRREGRRAVRSRGDERGRAEPADAPLHAEHLAHPRRDARHPGAGHGHERAHDGVDDGRVRRSRTATRPASSPASRSSSAGPTAARRRPGAASCWSCASCAATPASSRATCRWSCRGSGTSARGRRGWRTRRGSASSARATCAARCTTRAASTCRRSRRGSRDGRPVTEFAGAQAVDVEELLTLPCDVLIPAATGEVINTQNVERRAGAHRSSRRRTTR